MAEERSGVTAPRVRVISASRDSLAASLRELWAYRELLLFLAWRDVTVRYRQTFLGVAWAIVQPLATMALFTVFFGKLAGMPSDGTPYALFAYSGLLLWIAVANAVSSSAESLVGNPDLVTKVYIPRLLVPFAAILATLVDFALGFVVLVGLLIYYGVGVQPALAALPLVIVLAIGLAAAVGMWLAALNVKYRDVRYALPFAMQLWMFASPVIYPVSLVPEPWRALMMLNPAAGLIEGFRACLFGRPLDLAFLGASAGLTAAGLLYSVRVFRRIGDEFADVI